MRSSRIVSIAFGILLAGSAVALLAAGDSEEQASHTPRARRVRVAPIVEGSLARTHRFPGTVRAVRRARLSLLVAGRLASREVEVGDGVAAGQPLARLDAREYENAVRDAEAALAEAEARLAQKERDLRRVERLAAERAATREEREQAGSAASASRAARDAAAARLDEARRRLEETRLDAPFAGTIRAVHAEPEEHVGPGTPIVTIDGSGGRELEVELPETISAQLRVGDAVDVQLPLAGRTVRGHIVNLGSTARETGRLFPVRVSLDAEAPVRAGQLAELVLTLGDERALDVPASAVLNPGGQNAVVFRLEGEHVRRVPVTPLALGEGSVSVRGALSAGERVVIAGHGTLADGDRVEVLP